MQVHIIGPNLADQSNGDFHVHAKGCADVKRSALYRSPEFKSDRDSTVDVESVRDIVEYVYADQIGEGSMSWGDGVSSLYVLPCVGELPSETPAAPVVTRAMTESDLRAALYDVVCELRPEMTVRQAGSYVAGRIDAARSSGIVFG